MQPRKSIYEYYAVLGLRSGASTTDIKYAYRKLVKQWHPDRFTHDPRSQRIAEEKLKEINEAHDAICGAGPGAAYTPPAAQYRQPQNTYQRSTSSYSQAGYAAGQRRTASRQGYRRTTASTAYENPSYSYREISSSGVPRWIFVLAWLLIIGMRSCNTDAPSIPSAPASPQPQVTYIPLNAIPESGAQRQKEVEEALAIAARANKRLFPDKFPMRIDWPVSTKKAEVKDTSATGSQDGFAVKTLSAPVSTWPGFTPSTGAPPSKTPSVDYTTLNPPKEKIVFQANPRQ
jgi:DnaJ domain